MQVPHTADKIPVRSNSKQHIKRRKEDNNLLKGSLSSKDLRLRQNYIINKDTAYTSIQTQFTQISSKPQFLRFISVKKSIPPRSDRIAKQIVKNHQGKKRQPLARTRLRQRILFHKLSRPEHNSPVKMTIKLKDSDNQSTKYEEAETPKTAKVKPKPKHSHNYRNGHCESDDQNSMMIKQMVTKIEQSRGKVTKSDPYTARSKYKYYVAEAVKDYTNRDSLVRDHLFNSIYFLQILAQYNNTRDFTEGKPIYLPQSPRFKDKITVVFDLDETLVHCFEQLSQKHEVQIPVKFSGGHSMIAPVNIRPHAQEVLKQLSQQFELVVFTASHEAYANAVINHLDPNKQFIQHRLFRRHCDYIQQGYYVKDLRILGRDLSRVVIVDNAAYSYVFQVNNGIPIIPYYQGDTDYELTALKDYLLSLRSHSDVRTCNEKTFKLSKYLDFTTVDELVEDLYLHKHS